MVFLNVCKISSKLCGNVAVVVAGKSATAVSIVAPVSQIRGISSKAMRHRNPTTRPAPFPYKEKSYNFWRALFDTTTDRLDENSKLIVIDGPPAAGKAALAKELANELDMLYIPAPTMDKFLINDYGYNLRQIDHLLPDSCKSYDETDFLKNPSDIKASRMRYSKLILRYKQHLDALGHILSTGQGVVMDRSPFSDHIYTEAMAKHGFCNKNFLKFYYEARNNAMFALWQPHLVIYLDVPVAEVRRRIEARNRPFEKDSPASSPEYLQTLENLYKTTYLNTISNHAETLIYDWTEAGDTEIVVEDIERIDFEQYGVYDNKMKDWRRIDKWDWNNWRQRFTTNRMRLECLLNVPANYCPELQIDGEDYKVFERVWHEAPGQRYAKGFNAEMGDTGLLLKLK